MVRHIGEDFIDVERVAVTLMLPLQSTGVYRSEFDTPESDRFSADGDAAFSEEIFDITVAVTTRLRLNL
jgi:hypothetical protein